MKLLLKIVLIFSLYCRCVAQDTNMWVGNIALLGNVTGLGSGLTNGDGRTFVDFGQMILTSQLSGNIISNATGFFYPAGGGGITAAQATNIVTGMTNVLATGAYTTVGNSSILSSNNLISMAGVAVGGSNYVTQALLATSNFVSTTTALNAANLTNTAALTNLTAAIWQPYTINSTYVAGFGGTNFWIDPANGNLQQCFPTNNFYLQWTNSGASTNFTRTVRLEVHNTNSATGTIVATNIYAYSSGQIGFTNAWVNVLIYDFAAGTNMGSIYQLR